MLVMPRDRERASMGFLASRIVYVCFLKNNLVDLLELVVHLRFDLFKFECVE